MIRTHDTAAPGARKDPGPAGASPQGAGLSPLALEGVCARYGRLTAVADVSLDVAEGELLCLLGPSGSGKSTLLRLVAGLERPSGGRILLDGVEVSGSNRLVAAERRRVGMVFQDFALFPHLTIAANVAFGLRGRPRREVAQIVAATLTRLDLVHHAERYPHMLSGGERQRAALARALAPGPRILLMDEPFSSLDDRLRDRVRQETVDLLRETRTTSVVVTHEPEEAMRIADRIALLHGGRLVQCGRPADVYARPNTLFAARFFSDVNELAGTCREGRVETPLGSFAVPSGIDGARARVGVRPQHVRVSATPTGLSGHVVRSLFLGEVEQLAVAIAGLDTPLVIRTFGRTALDPGDSVFLDINPADVLVCPEERDALVSTASGAIECQES
jgi:iron(III) transport system ATP-binding protein